MTSSEKNSVQLEQSIPTFRRFYLEEDLNAVDEEEDDDDEHEDGVAPVENVGVELAILVLDPNLKKRLISIKFI